MDVYRPPSNLAMEVAHLLGDEEMIDAARNHRKVSIDVPSSFTGRVIETVAKVKRKLIDALPSAAPEGRTAAKIVREKRKEPLF